MTFKQLVANTLLVAALAAASSTANAVVILGHTYTPSGADFTITSVQGETGVNPLGASETVSQVNHDFEFTGSTGVTYDSGNGVMRDFGIGLYAGANNATQSTALRIDYTNMVMASSIVVTLQDFDISSKNTFFNPQKVEPVVILLGLNNTIVAKANPSDIFSALSPVAGSKDGDLWNLNFGTLLNNLNLADGPLKGFILAADMSAGETPNSDPYLLINVGGGIPAVPEADTYAVGLFGIGIAVASVVRSLKRRAV